MKKERKKERKKKAKKKKLTLGLRYQCISSLVVVFMSVAAQWMLAFGVMVVMVEGGGVVGANSDCVMNSTLVT